MEIYEKIHAITHAILSGKENLRFGNITKKRHFRVLPIFYLFSYFLLNLWITIYKMMTWMTSQSFASVEKTSSQNINEMVK